MGLTGLQAYALAMKSVKGLASGFDHATRTGDNTFDIFFIDGSSVSLLIPAPKDGVGIKDVAMDTNGHLICTMTDNTEIDAGELPGGGILTEDLTATQEIGSVTKGKKYEAGTKLEAIIRDILIKEVAPSVVLTFNPNQLLYDAAADELSEVIMVATVTNGTYEPKTLEWYVDGVKVHEQTIGIGRSVVNTFNYTYTPASSIKTDTVFKAVVTDGRLTGQSSKTIKFVGKSYYGTVADNVSDPDEAIIKALDNDVLKDVKKLVYSGVTMDYGKVVYAYPADFGALTSIMDKKNNINYTATYTKTTATVDGIEYFVYTKNNPSKAVDVELTFE